MGRCQRPPRGRGLDQFNRHRTGGTVWIDARGERTVVAGHDAWLTPAAASSYETGAEALRALVGTVDPEAPWEHPDAAPRLLQWTPQRWRQPGLRSCLPRTDE
jgi:hypothetical protein